MARQRRIYRRKDDKVFRIDMTAMMSLFSILILFLLKNNSIEVGNLTLSDKLKLPVSTSTKPGKVALQIVVSKDNLMVDDKIIMTVDEIRTQKELLLKPLSNILGLYRKKTELIGKTNENIKFTREIIMQSDKTIDFSVLKKIMYTSGQAGYGEISLLVISSE